MSQAPSIQKNTTLINNFVNNLFKFDLTSSYTSDKDKLKNEIYALLTPNLLRFRPVEEEVKTVLKDMITQFVDKNAPIKILNAMGGFKNYRIDSAPHIDYAEIFHLSFFTHVLSKICQIYEPGIHLEYSGDAQMACIVDNLRREWVDIYLFEFNLLLDQLNTHLPKNMHLSYKHFLDFYDFDEMSNKIQETTQDEDLNDPKNKELIDKYYNRAKSNFCFDGLVDFSHSSPPEKEQMIKKSVIKAYKWYDLDFAKRGDYFGSFICVCNLQEFPGSYCIRSVRYLPSPPFWQGKGVIKIINDAIIPVILHANQYAGGNEDTVNITIARAPLPIDSLNSIPLWQPNI